MTVTLKVTVTFKLDRKHPLGYTCAIPFGGTFMDFHSIDNNSTRRIAALKHRVDTLRENNHYFYNQAVEEMLPGSKVRVNGRVMGMYASYSYLGLVGHPRINEAAKRAVDKFGTGTNGVRTLAGTLTIHNELEETI